MNPDGQTYMILEDGTIGKPEDVIRYQQAEMDEEARKLKESIRTDTEHRLSDLAARLARQDQNG